MITSGLAPEVSPGEVVLLPDDKTVPMRSRLKCRAREWESRFGPSSRVAKLVRRGVSLPLKVNPTPYRAVQRSLQPDHREAISVEVQRMLDLGAVRLARPRSDAIVSSIFCVSKKGTSKLRPCLDPGR